MKISTKELREMIRESIGEVIKEAEVSGTISTGGPARAGGLAKAGAPARGEDPRWKRQVTDVAKKAIAGDAKAFANAVAMTKDSGPGTYGKEVHDYLQAWNAGKTDAPAPQGLGEAVMEARIRKIVRESLQAEKAKKTVKK